MSLRSPIDHAIFVYDDRIAVHSEAKRMTGVDHYGQLYLKRRHLDDIVRSCASRAGYKTVHHIRRSADKRHLLDDLLADPSVDTILYMPANLAVTDQGLFESEIAKLAFLPVDVAIQGAGIGSLPPLTRFRRSRFIEFLRRNIDDERSSVPDHPQDQPEYLPNHAKLLDLSEPAAFLSYLTGAFDARVFNQVTASNDQVIKKSSDRAKMRKEHDFWYQLPHHLQPFFVQPHSYEETEADASYKLERLSIPDMAVQWIHKAIDDSDFEAFLSKAFRWFEQREVRTVSKQDVDAARRTAYVDKVEQRLSNFRGSETARALDRTLLAGTSYRDCSDLFDRYLARIAKLTRHDQPALALSHGDFCFSNILYDKRAKHLKLIDPRGALTYGEAFLDPYYDLAKLSHSIMGLYDFVNAGLFDLDHDTNLALTIGIDAGDIAAKQDMFRAAAEAHNFDWTALRLYEASLFLSMVPLHAENPRKCLGFLLTAAKILDNSP